MATVQSRLGSPDLVVLGLKTTLTLTSYPVSLHVDLAYMLVVGKGPQMKALIIDSKIACLIIIHISLLKPFDGIRDKVHIESFINYFTDVVSWR